MNELNRIRAELDAIMKEQSEAMTRLTEMSAAIDGLNRKAANMQQLVRAAHDAVAKELLDEMLKSGRWTLAEIVEANDVRHKEFSPDALEKFRQCARLMDEIQEKINECKSASPDLVLDGLARRCSDLYAKQYEKLDSEEPSPEEKQKTQELRDALISEMGAERLASLGMAPNDTMTFANRSRIVDAARVMRSCIEIQPDAKLAMRVFRAVTAPQPPPVEEKDTKE